MLLGTLSASLLRNMLADKVFSEQDRVIREKQ